MHTFSRSVHSNRHFGHIVESHISTNSLPRIEQGEINAIAYRATLIAASSGHFDNLKLKTKLAAKLLFHDWQPLSVAVKGYWPTKIIGFGEDLPAGVARQWRQWCRSPGYVENSFGEEIRQHHYADIKAPVLSLTATDDHIAVPANVEDFLRLLPNAQIKNIFWNQAVLA